MAKMIDMATVSISFGEEIGAAEVIRQQLKSVYLDNGWELFNAQCVGIAEHKIMMIYVFVKYEAEPIVSFVESGSEVAPRKRGRPAKAVQEELPLEA